MRETGPRVAGSDWQVLRRGCSVSVVHVLGAASLVGWLALSRVSHHEGALLPAFGLAWSWAWLLFLIGLWHLRSAAAAGSMGRLGPIVGWAVAFRVAGLLAAPVLEDDHYRFLWDGRQFALTGNPYATAPAGHFGDTSVPEDFAEILDHINYPHVPTIYGPLCQVGFLASYWLAPARLWPWKVLVIGADLVLMAFTILLARRGPSPKAEALTVSSEEGAGTPAFRAAFVFGWCPLAIFETSFNAHPEVLGVMFLVGALWCWSCGWRTACAVLCGCALAAKLTAGLVVPLLLGRSIRAWLIAALAVGAAYLPFWLQGRGADFAGLAVFASGWEFNSSFFAIAQWAAGPEAARWICGGVLAGVCGFLFWRSPAFRKERSGEAGPEELAALLWSGLLVFGAFFLLSAVSNPWYLLWLVPLAALRPCLTAMTAFAVVGLSYATGLNLGDSVLGNFEHPGWVRSVEFGAIAVAGLLEVLTRHRGSRSRQTLRVWP